MHDLIPREQLYPFLLDRLTDHDPRKTREGSRRNVLSLRQYVSAVRRDLRWLLNSCCLSREDSIYQYNEAPRSVLNYGIPDLCGMCASGVDTAEMESRLREAILAFEPRIMPATLIVEVSADLDTMSANAVCFEIGGEIWAQPAPEYFYVKTEVDLETGQWEV